MVVQDTGGESPAVLAKYDVAYNATATLEGTPLNDNPLKVRYKTTGGGGGVVRIGSTRYSTIDEVSGSYVTLVCSNQYGFGNDYRFGFNGQEKVNEIAGIGNHNTAEFWEYDTRLARRWNPDPVRKPWESPYATFSGNPIYMVDPKGDDARVNKQANENGKGGNITISTKIHAKGGSKAEREAFINNGTNQANYMKSAGLMSGSYTDDDGGVWNISMNIEYVDGETTAFEDGDNIMDLSKLNDPGTNRSSVSSGDVQERIFENGRWKVTGNYTEVNRTGNSGEMRGGMPGLNGQTIYHESMHFMGLSDRYETTSLQTHRGYKGDVMSAEGGYNFNKNHWNNWGRAVLSNPDSKFILRQRVDIQGVKEKVMLPENYPTTNGSRR